MLFPLVLPILFLFGSPSEAHPVGGKPASHRLRVQILQDQLAIGYLAELPQRLLHQHEEDAKHTSIELYKTLHDELSRGITARFEGVSLSLSASEFQPDRVRQNPRSTAFEFHFTGEIPGESGELEIQNTNLDGHHAFFYTEVSAEEPIAVESSSLLLHTADEPTVDFNGRWSVLESHRNLVLRVSNWRMHESRGALRSGADLLNEQNRTSTGLMAWVLLVAAGLLLAIWRIRFRPSRAG